MSVGIKILFSNREQATKLAILRKEKSVFTQIAAAIHDFR